jgi:hypothetical protein
MNILGNVISYNPNTKVAKQGGGTYDAWELVYRTTENEVKTVTKPATGLRFNKALANGLADLKPGEDFTLTMEKKGQFWEAQAVGKGHNETTSEVPQAAAKTDGNRSEVRGGKVTGSNYETPEERAKKQVLIIRQSSIRDAISLLARDGAQPKVDEIIEVAKELEKHVWKDFSKLAKKYIEVSLTEVE